MAGLLSVSLEMLEGFNNTSKKFLEGCGETGQRLRTLFAFAEHLSSISSPTRRLTSAYNSSSRRYGVFFWPPQSPACMVLRQTSKHTCLHIFFLIVKKLLEEWLAYRNFSVPCPFPLLPALTQPKIQTRESQPKGPSTNPVLKVCSRRCNLSVLGCIAIQFQLCYHKSQADHYS